MNHLNGLCTRGYIATATVCQIVINCGLYISQIFIREGECDCLINSPCIEFDGQFYVCKPLKELMNIF